MRLILARRTSVRFPGTGVVAGEVGVNCDGQVTTGAIPRWFRGQ